jgi:hypothetical protein
MDAHPIPNAKHMHMTYHIQMYNTYAVAGNEVVMTLQINGPLHFALCNYLINLHFNALSCNKSCELQYVILY